MSYAVARMQKMKSPDLKGIQFHNQRERKSLTNEDINEERSYKNYDLKNDENINYNERVKEIIESQKVGTRKTRKDAVLVNELLITSDRDFFEKLNETEQRRFFDESYKLFSERYGKQNIAYATVHNDEKTPHMHLGVVPMREGKLQGKNVFNRQELLWLQDKYPKHMQELGFELKRGEKGSDREHIETAKFKKQTLEKEITSLEKDLSLKRNEVNAYVEKIDVDIEVKAKKHYKNVEVPTGEKSIFGKEKTEIKKKETDNVIVSKKDYKKLVSAAKENEHLKRQVTEFANSDIYKLYDKERKQKELIKDKHNDLVQRFNSNVNDYNELVEENSSLKSKISDLKHEIGSIYKSTKEFLKERTDSLKAFKSVFNDLVTKVKEKSPKSEFEILDKREKRKEKDRGMEL